ncbi:hypothetical protein IE077_000200 [Cardiosporidium cionae]|uniref:Uncharacterized protein n=1 Tax=Cardiosporidium cionae TaxID=476202 RepID=A0ABQ7J552_9APIC|nr:hypothetical protein IE077_000200 [Cardiosporidium cionae]|eukprot:KAF8819118.1 hypothetical protein IE077_000200 [Cardiosporidium cionae]
MLFRTVSRPSSTASHCGDAIRHYHSHYTSFEGLRASTLQTLYLPITLYDGQRAKMISSALPAFCAKVHRWAPTGPTSAGCLRFSTRVSPVVEAAASMPQSSSIPSELRFILKLPGPALCTFAEGLPAAAEATPTTPPLEIWEQESSSSMTVDHTTRTSINSKAHAAQMVSSEGDRRPSEDMSPSVNESTVTSPPFRITAIEGTPSSQPSEKPPAAAVMAIFASPLCWSLVAARAMQYSPPLRVIDALRLLEAFALRKVMDRALYIHVGELLTKSIYQLSMTQLCQTISLYFSANLYPRLLFVEVFNAMIRLSHQLYSHEFTEALTTLATYHIANTDVLHAFSKTLAQRVAILKCRDVVIIVDALHFLEYENPHLYTLLDEKCKLDIQKLSPQELLDTLMALSQVRFCWKLYETLLATEFTNRLKTFQKAEDVDQLADPFACLEYLKTKKSLEKTFLLVLSLWCAKAVKRPPTRSYKRPFVRNLLQLYDCMREFHLEEDGHLQEAITYFVASKGGKDRSYNKTIKPISYQTGRRYIYKKDEQKVTSSSNSLHRSSSLNGKTNLFFNKNEKTDEEFYLHFAVYVQSPLHGNSTHPFGLQRRRSPKKKSPPSSSISFHIKPKKDKSYRS